MYYNTNENILVSRAPRNLIKPDGSIFIDFHQSDINILSDYGYYTVRNDNNSPPETNSIEDINKRNIVLDKPYADIERIWITHKIEPTITTTNNIDIPVINEDA